jgi:hypothetical protein
VVKACEDAVMARARTLLSYFMRALRVAAARARTVFFLRYTVRGHCGRPMAMLRGHMRRPIVHTHEQ